MTIIDHARADAQANGWTVDERSRALCCECGMLRTTTRRGKYAGEFLNTIGLRMVVRRKCQVCGVVTNHAIIREDESRDVAETDTCAPAARYGGFYDLSKASENEERALQYYAEILADADRHGAWYAPRFARTVEQVADELWPLGIRMADARDLSREDRDGRRTTGVYDWYPDDDQTIVTPDVRSTEREIVILLRAAEQLLTDPEVRTRYEMRMTDEGSRWLGLAHYAQEMAAGR